MKQKKMIFIMMPVVYFISILLPVLLLEDGYSQAQFDRLSRIGALVADKVPEAERAFLSALKQTMEEDGQDFLLQKGNQGEDFLIQRELQDEDFLIQNELQDEDFWLQNMAQSDNLLPQNGSQIRNFLLENGYRNGDFLINERSYLWMVSIGSFSLGSLFFIFVFSRRSRQKRRRIEELTLYLEKVNLNGTASILQTKEDDFSLLQDEIYKTVTTLYQTREEALKARKTQAEHLANIAHQLKTAITAASVLLQLGNHQEIGSSSIGEKDYYQSGQRVPRQFRVKEKESPELTERVKIHLERLSTLAEKLLLLTRIDAGTLKLQQTPVDVYTVLNLAADSLNELPVAGNCTVSIPEHGCVTMTGDLDWTMEAIINLLKNCMEHSPEKGTVYCDYSENALYTEILIRDEGAGFAKEDFPHLFERFYRGKNAADDSVGIGLAFAKSIFEMQNGTVTARNLPEVGACFEIRVYRQ